MRVKGLRMQSFIINRVLLYITVTTLRAILQIYNWTYIFNLSISIEIWIRKAGNAKTKEKEKEAEHVGAFANWNPSLSIEFEIPKRFGAEDATTGQVIESSALFLRTTGVC